MCEECDKASQWFSDSVQHDWSKVSSWGSAMITSGDWWVTLIKLVCDSLIYTQGGTTLVSKRIKGFHDGNTVCNYGMIHRSELT